MITHVHIQGFKKLKDMSFDLRDRLVLIGPNNAGKTSVFQALCLWEAGVRKCLSLENEKTATLNRKELLNSIVADVSFLWTERQTSYPPAPSLSKMILNVPLYITIEGIDNHQKWSCKTTFSFSNTESIYCSISGDFEPLRAMLSDQHGIRFSFLQPMSGLAEEEDLLQRGSVDRKLGMGRTAEVLRNICYTVRYPETRDVTPEQGQKHWESLCAHVYRLFGCRLSEPVYSKLTGLIELTYQEESGIAFDISASGRGVQQALLILAYLYSHPGSVLLLDEPDAHLEMIRQRAILDVIAEVATEMGSQVMIASHSEVVLNQAAQTGDVLALIENQAFLLTGNNIAPFRKSLTEIGWEKYYLARLKKHVLYLEGATDLRMLQAFARKLAHPVETLLSEANIEFLSVNLSSKAEQHFFALRTVFPELKGMVLLDRIDSTKQNKALPIVCWQKRELENYFASPELLLRFAEQDGAREIMEAVIQDYTLPAYLRDPNNSWWSDAKLSDEWMDIIFREYYQRKGGYAAIGKSEYHTLITLLEPENVHPEVVEKLDLLYDFLKA